MPHAFKARTTFAALFATTAVLGLSACGGKEEKTEYKTNVEDKSGGKLIVEDAQQKGVAVKEPATPMTNVPEEKAPAGN